MMKYWQVGVFTLIGVCLGILAGIAFQAIPPSVAIGTALGTGLDSWLAAQQNEVSR